MSPKQEDSSLVRKSRHPFSQLFTYSCQDSGKNNGITNSDLLGEFPNVLFHHFSPILFCQERTVAGSWLLFFLDRPGRGARLPGAYGHSILFPCLELFPFDTFGIGIFMSSVFWNLVRTDIQVITSEGKLVIVFYIA